jgi:4-amino-4-deoxy-L-arabinose transferase-like glycosyltransferase
VCAVTAALRLVALEADPPAGLEDAFLTDEGWWAHNARNHLHFGRWITDDFNQALFATPVHTVLVRGAFALFGAGLGAARSVAALAGIATLVLIGSLVARQRGTPAALAVVGILGLDFFSLSYQRVALVEALPVAWMSLAAWSALCMRDRRWGYLIAGAAAVLAALSKMNAVFFAPALALALLLRQDSESRVTELAWLAAGGALVGGAFLVCFALPNWQDFVLQNGRLAQEGGLRGMLLVTNGFALGLARAGGGQYVLGGLLAQAVLPVSLALLWMARLGARVHASGIRAALADLDALERLALCWIGAFGLYLATNVNLSDRRYYVFVVPLALLGAALLGRRDSALDATSGAAGKLAGAVAVALGAVVYLRVPLMTWLEPVFDRLPLGSQAGISMQSAAALATVGILALAVPFTLALLPRFAHVLRGSALLVLVAGTATLLNGARLVKEASSLEYGMRDARVELLARLGPDARVFGGIANTLLLSDPVPTLFLLDRASIGYPVFGQASLERFAPTHAIVLAPDGDVQGALDREVGTYDAVPDSVRFLPLCRKADGKPRFTVATAAIRRRAEAAETRP